MGSISEKVERPSGCQAAVVDLYVGDYAHEVTVVCGDRSNSLRTSMDIDELKNVANRQRKGGYVGPVPVPSPSELAAAYQTKCNELSAAATQVLGAMCLGCPNRITQNTPYDR